MKLNNPNILVTYYVNYTNSQLSIKIVILYFDIEKNITFTTKILLSMIFDHWTKRFSVEQY